MAKKTAHWMVRRILSTLRLACQTLTLLTMVLNSTATLLRSEAFTFTWSLRLAISSER
jgi:hypothetical protein